MLCFALQLAALAGIVKLRTMRWLVMAGMAQPHGEAIAVTGLAVATSKNAVTLEIGRFAAKIVASAAGVNDCFHGVVLLFSRQCH